MEGWEGRGGEERGGLEQQLSGGRVSPPCVNKLSAALPAHFRTLHYREKRLSRHTNTQQPQPRAGTPPDGLTEQPERGTGRGLVKGIKYRSDKLQLLTENFLSWLCM